MTTIRYFIPEDGDSESQPNVFLAPKPRQQGYPPTLGQVKSSFPLPGRYHFRFKSPMVPGGDREKSAMPVWMDCTDDRTPVPLWRNSIIAKVTRIGVEEDEEYDEDDADFQRAGAAAAGTTPAPRSVEHHHPQPPSHSSGGVPAAPHHQQQPSFGDIFGEGTPTPTMAHHASQAAPAATPGNWLEGHPHHHAAPSAGQKDSLLDMHSPVYTQHAAQTSHADFLGMTSPPVSGGYPTPQQPAAPPLQQQQQQQAPYGAQQGRSASGGGAAFDGLTW